MSTFDTKRVWHSSLTYRSPLIVSFATGQVLKSKYADDDGNFPFNIYFKVRGDDKEYYYHIENDDIADYLRENAEGRVWYKLVAEGSRDEAQVALTTVDEGELPPAQETTSRQKSSGGRQNNYAPAQSYSTGSLAGDMEKCFESAVGIIDGLDNYNFAVDDASQLDVAQRMAVSLFIQWSNANFSVPLVPGDEPEPEVGEEVEDYSEEIESLLNDMALKSGTSHDGKKLASTVKKIEELVEKGIDSVDERNSVKEWLEAEIEYQKDPGEEELPF